MILYFILAYARAEHVTKALFNRSYWFHWLHVNMEGLCNWHWFHYLFFFLRTWPILWSRIVLLRHSHANLSGLLKSKILVVCNFCINDFALHSLCFLYPLALWRQSAILVWILPKAVDSLQAELSLKMSLGMTEE